MDKKGVTNLYLSLLASKLQKKRLSPKPFPFLRLTLQMAFRILAPFTEEETEGARELWAKLCSVWSDKNPPSLTAKVLCSSPAPPNGELP